MAAKKQPEPSYLTIKVDGEGYEIRDDNLTFGECSELENYMGQSLGEIETFSVKAVMFKLFLAKRKRHPDTTLAELEDIPVTDFLNALNELADAAKKARSQKGSSEPKTPETTGDPS